MLDIYGTLEIEKVLSEVSNFSSTEIAREKIKNLRMLPLDDAIKALNEVEEMTSFIARYGSLPINAQFNLLPFIEIAKKGGVLTPLDLEHVASDILCAKKIADFFRKADKSTMSNILSYVDRLIDLSSLEIKIHKVIAPNLSIKDDASDKLYSIRKQIHKKESEVRERSHSLIAKYKEFLSEETITIRNDHFVLPINTAYKSKVSGIIHDISDSGQTTFIEPSSLVELSNELCSLRVDEKEEINYLLRVLSEEVFLLGDDIIKNNEILGELDFIASKASYSIKHNCIGAGFVKDRVINFIGARHPLIDEEKVVSNDFKFSEDNRLIIISGPNAGGKTVALKTLGLLVMMSQMGLAIPTKEKAYLSYFPRIYADIGDNQSLSDNLSTFAAHVSNLSTITHFVTGKDLVLLDELGTGTSPNEGEALALAVSDFLLKKNCFAFISSHFEKMKEYAYRRKGVSNAMMVFDEKNLMPIYSLKIGYPGRSYGLEMAYRYHLDGEVISLAKQNLQKSHTQGINDVIDKLNKVLHENENINKQLNEGKRILEGKAKDIAYQSKVLQSKKDSLLEDVERIKKQMIEEAKKEIDDALKVLNNSNAKQHELIAAKTNLSKLNDDAEIFESSDEINIGDYAEVAGLSIIGKVIKINKDKVELLTTDGMMVKSTLNKLTKAVPPADKKLKSNINVDEMIKSKSTLKTEINLIGKHVDEAINELAKYLDDCLVRKYKEVRIIHGMGTGALRDAVRDYLDNCDFVVFYRYGESFEGATGATVVTLR